MADGINPDECAASRGAGKIMGFRPAPAPVAHISLMPSQDDGERSNPDIPYTQNLSVSGVQFYQPIRKIKRHIKTLAIGRDRDASRNVRLAFAGTVGIRQSDRKKA